MSISQAVNNAKEVARRAGVEGYPQARGMDYLEDHLGWGTPECQRAIDIFLEWCDSNNVF